MEYCKEDNIIKWVVHKICYTSLKKHIAKKFLESEGTCMTFDSNTDVFKSIQSWIMLGAEN